MEFAPGVPLPLSLALLALLDGLSVGTLLIPVFLLLAPGRVRVRRILLYLASITVFYLLVGLLFLWGLVNLVEVASGFLSSEPGRILRLVLGVGMLVGSFFVPGARKKKDEESAVPVVSATASSLEGVRDPLTPPPPAAPAPATPRPGRLMRWRDKLLDPTTPPLAVMGVAVAAGLVEVATMLPYIMAMTLLAGAGISAPLSIAALAGYCVIMILPALVLLVLRIVAARAIEGPLQRLGAWLARTGAENTAWIIGIIGFLIARAAASELGLFTGLGSILPGTR